MGGSCKGIQLQVSCENVGIHCWRSGSNERNAALTALKHSFIPQPSFDPVMKIKPTKLTGCSKIKNEEGKTERKKEKKTLCAKTMIIFPNPCYPSATPRQESPFPNHLPVTRRSCLIIYLFYMCCRGNCHSTRPPTAVRRMSLVHLRRSMIVQFSRQEPSTTHPPFFPRFRVIDWCYVTNEARRITTTRDGKPRSKRMDGDISRFAIEAEY